MKHWNKTRVAALLGASVLTACTAAGDGQSALEFDVTVTNNSPQVVTPPLVVVHQSDVSLFTVGQPASSELEILAETGSPAALLAAVTAMAGVADAAAGPGVVPPGESVTIRVSTAPGADYVSVTGMFATTNDAFFGVQGVRLPADGQPAALTAPIYDAGSEANNELCSHIPGPPCPMDSGNARTASAEGTVQPHPGLTGTGDLDAAALSWDAEDIQVTITAAPRRAQVSTPGWPPAF